MACNRSADMKINFRPILSEIYPVRAIEIAAKSF
jgi:hypothetical protein